MCSFGRYLYIRFFDNPRFSVSLPSALHGGSRTGSNHRGPIPRMRSSRSRSIQGGSHACTGGRRRNSVQIEGHPKQHSAAALRSTSQCWTSVLPHPGYRSQTWVAVMALVRCYREGSTPSPADQLVEKRGPSQAVREHRASYGTHPRRSPPHGRRGFRQPTPGRLDRSIKAL